ncbi:MAG: hypothetical protein LBR66_06875 [Candidatus Symbiothrix sp.]|nr:hypothetical protein [Candidatus Symbiothrix sp.]
MKKYFVFASLLLIAAGFCACDEDNPASEEATDQRYREILDSYVHSTVVPTYKALAEAALEMRAANEALKTQPTDENMQRASDAWMAARIWWEKSEAFLFGPVGESALDIDGHIDSWPLELADIQQSIASGGVLTGREAWSLDAEVIGFHVTEYLLYREGQSRPAADLSAAELSYLTAATDALVWDCVLAYVAWVGEDNVPTTMKTIFYENPDVVAHLENNPAYKQFSDRLINATNYSSMAAALAEISDGAADIAEEVGVVKIQQPYQSHKVEDVESWYSWHSLDDYKNNILSIKNAYLGGVDDQTRTGDKSLSAYIASTNKTLDNQVKSAIEDCLQKIDAIGANGQYSFYQVVNQQINQAQVDAATDACLALKQLLTQISESL